MTSEDEGGGAIDAGIPEPSSRRPEGQPVGSAAPGRGRPRTDGRRWPGRDVRRRQPISLRIRSRTSWVVARLPADWMTNRGPVQVGGCAICGRCRRCRPRRWFGIGQEDQTLTGGEAPGVGQRSDHVCSATSRKPDHVRGMLLIRWMVQPGRGMNRPSAGTAAERAILLTKSPLVRHPQSTRGTGETELDDSVHVGGVGRRSVAGSRSASR